MREQVREQLPPTVVALMDEIEAFACVEIQFQSYDFSTRATQRPGRAAATLVTHEGATIFLPAVTDVDAHGVTHELLHIHRYWVESVARLDLSRNAEANAAACANFENTLEHLFIVPREADYGFDRSGWNDAARLSWERRPWPESKTALDRRNRALLGVIETKISDDQAVHDLAAECLAKEGLTEVAARFSSRLDELSESKERSAGCLARAMQAPSGLFRLVYFDVRRRQFHFAPLPSY